MYSFTNSAIIVHLKCTILTVNIQHHAESHFLSVAFDLLRLLMALRLCPVHHCVMAHQMHPKPDFHPLHWARTL